MGSLYGDYLRGEIPLLFSLFKLLQMKIPCYSTDSATHAYQESKIRNNFVPKSRTEVLETKRNSKFAALEVAIFNAEYLVKIR